MKDLRLWYNFFIWSISFARNADEFFSTHAHGYSFSGKCNTILRLVKPMKYCSPNFSFFSDTKLSFNSFFKCYCLTLDETFFLAGTCPRKTFTKQPLRNLIKLESALTKIIYNGDYWKFASIEIIFSLSFSRAVITAFEDGKEKMVGNGGTMFNE